MNLSQILNDYCEQHLKLRESLGYTVESDQYILHRFIEFCVEYNPDASTITKDMLDKWLIEHAHKSNSTQRNFIITLRHFTHYIRRFDGTVFIPDKDYNIGHSSFRPYIFTDDELKKLFHAFDNLPTYHRYRNREFIVPVMFRMMYCCGMRPGEPIRLLREDVNTETNDIYITQSKHHKDRHIVMSEEMGELCRAYDRLAGERKWFFEKWDHGPFEHHWVTSQMHRCWKACGFNSANEPRPYDLRHAFATRRLTKWIHEKKDIMTLIPYISTYMGHSSFEHTLYYIHLLPENLRMSPGIDWSRFDGLWGEVE